MQEYFLGTIVFGLPKQMVSVVGSLSKDLESHFETQEQLVEPHITIYQAKFPIQSKESVIQALHKICSQHVPLMFKYLKPNIKNKFVGIALKKTKLINKLHEDVVQTLNPLRQGALKSVYVERRNEFSVSEQNMIDKRGYPYVFDEYIPHITLCLLANIDDTILASKSIIGIQDFMVDKIQLIVYSNGVKEYYSFACGTR